MSYWNPEDLQRLIGASTFLACFDDNNTGSADYDSVTLVQELADAEIDGALATEYETEYPLSNPPKVVIKASLMFGRAMAYERRPEYVKSVGRDPKVARDQAQAFLNKLLNAREFMVDALGISSTPANVGGAVVDGANRIYVDNPDGTQNSGDF